MVSIAFPPTLALKRLAVSAPNSEAGRARFGSVSGRNSNQFDPEFQALVSQKYAQLIERPTISPASFFFVTWLLIQVLCDTSQIFYSYYFFVISSRLDNAITNRMVEPSLKSSLLTRQPFQKFSAPAARTPRANTCFLLESLPQVGVMVAPLIYCIGIPIISFTRISNRSSTQIDTQALISNGRRGVLADISCVRVNGFGCLRLNLNLNVILPRLPLNQSSRSWYFSAQQVPLIITNQQWETVSTIFQRQLNRPVMLIKVEYSCIVSRASWLKFLDRTVFKFRCFAIARDSRNCLTDQISWQLKSLFTKVVSLFMDSQSTRNFWVNCRVDPVTAISKTDERGINLVMFQTC